MEVVREVESMPTNDDKPSEDVVIVDCGELDTASEAATEERKTAGQEPASTSTETDDGRTKENNAATDGSKPQADGEPMETDHAAAEEN